MRERIDDIIQIIWYGVLRRRPNIDFSELPNKFDYRCFYDSENDVHWIESLDLPEFYVSAKTPEELGRNFHETLMVYYDIPRYFAKKMKPDLQLNYINKKTGETQTFEYKFKEEVAHQTA